MKKNLKINAETANLGDMQYRSESLHDVDGALAFAPFWRLTSPNWVFTSSFPATFISTL